MSLKISLRIISLALLFAMILSIFPAPARAEGSADPLREPPATKEILPGTQLTQTNFINSGDQVVFYNPYTQVALSLDDSTGTIVPSKVTLEDGVLTASEDTAIFTVRYYDEKGGTLQTQTGSYLTADSETRQLSYTPEITDCSFWSIYIPADVYPYFLMENEGMEFPDSPSMPCLQFQDGVFTIGGKHYNYDLSGDTRFYFLPYTLGGSVDCDHRFDEGTVLQSPTCTEDGLKIYSCTRCNTTRTRYLAPTEHALELNHCSDTGFAHYTCSVCHFEQEEEIKVTGHVWVADPVTGISSCEACDATGGIFTAVESVEDLTDGDRIIFAADVVGRLIAFDSFHSGFGTFYGTVVSSSSDVLERYRDSLIWELVQTEEGFALYSPDGYLYQQDMRDPTFGLFYRDEAYAWKFTENGEYFRLVPADQDLTLIYNGYPDESGWFELLEPEDPIEEDHHFLDLKIYKYTPAPTHTHSYEEGFCTVCGKDAPGKEFTQTNFITSGDSIVFYNHYSGTALSLEESTGKLVPSAVTVENGVLTTSEDTAVFTVRQNDNDHRLGNVTLQIYTGEYLTSDPEECNLFYTAEASPYGLWWIHTNPDYSDLAFLISNLAVRHPDATASYPTIGFVDDSFAMDSKHGSYDFVREDILYFGIYALNGSTACDHTFDDGVITKNPTCLEEGIKVSTCTRCSKTHTVYLSTTDHDWAPDQCSPTGYSPLSCTVCGLAQEELYEVSGHDWIGNPCGEPSYCKICGMTGGNFTRIDTLDDLADGDRIVISTTVANDLISLSDHGQDNGYLFDSYTEFLNDTLTSYYDSVIWTLIKTDAGFAIYDSRKGYLTPNGDKSAFAFDEDGSEPYSWQITWEEDHFQIATADGNDVILFTGTCSGDGAFRLRPVETSTEKYCFPDLQIYKYNLNGTLTHYDDDGDNICENCYETVEDAVLLGNNISLNGNIEIRFMMSLSDEVTGDENSYMLFTQEGKEPVRLYHHERDERSPKKGAYNYIYSYDVRSMEMTDTITAQYFYGDGQCSEVYTYSVKEYADNMRKKLSEDDPLTALLDAMLRYGAASQLYFGYHTERLADAGLEPVDYSAVSIEGYPSVPPIGTELVTPVGATLLLESETTLRFFFRVDTPVENVTISYKGQVLDLTARNNLYSVDIPNILAPELGDYFTITVEDGTGTAQISYSPMNYCTAVKKNASGNHPETLQNVAAALYLYSQSARAYFEQHQ